MAIEDYVCSLLLLRCGHALLATGNGRIASCVVKMLVSLQFTEADRGLHVPCELSEEDSISLTKVRAAS